VHWLLWGLAAFAVSLAVSVVLVAVVLVSLPAGYFRDPDARQLWVDRHPAVRLLLHALKNLLGLALIAAGVLLSLPGVPGQGLATIFVGVLLLDVPGKHRWERQCVSRPSVRRGIDALRVRFGRPPLELDP
jgi:hypothetical protein